MGAITASSAQAHTKGQRHLGTHRRPLMACHRSRGHHKHRRLCRGKVARAHHKRSHSAHSLIPAVPVRSKTASPTSASLVQSTQSKIASVLANTCQNTNLMPQAANLALINAATLCLINQERARNGVLPLQINAALEQAALGHSQAMVSEDYFDHVSPSGQTPLDRLTAAGYIPNSEVGYVIGENIAWGTLNLATPQATVNAWIASPEHLANILKSQYTETGIGVSPQAPESLSQGQPSAIYTQEFGVIIR